MTLLRTIFPLCAFMSLAPTMGHASASAAAAVRSEDEPGESITIRTATISSMADLPNAFKGETGKQFLGVDFDETIAVLPILLSPERGRTQQLKENEAKAAQQLADEDSDTTHNQAYYKVEFGRVREGMLYHPISHDAMEKEALSGALTKIRGLGTEIKIVSAAPCTPEKMNFIAVNKGNTDTPGFGFEAPLTPTDSEGGDYLWAKQTDLITGKRTGKGARLLNYLDKTSFFEGEDKRYSLALIDNNEGTLATFQREILTAIPALTSKPVTILSIHYTHFLDNTSAQAVIDYYKTFTKREAQGFANLSLGESSGTPSSSSYDSDAVTEYDDTPSSDDDSDTADAPKQDPREALMKPATFNSLANSTGTDSDNEYPASDDDQDTPAEKLEL